MKNLNLNQLFNKKKLFFLTALLAGIPLLLYQVSIQQFFRQYASVSSLSAQTLCSSDSGKVEIEVSFSNLETAKTLSVIATDLQTGKSLDLGDVKPKETKRDKILTDLNTLGKGAVKFDVKPNDGSGEKQILNKDYKELRGCKPGEKPTMYCPVDQPKNQAYCKWDIENTAESYDILIKEIESGKVIKSERVHSPASQSAFLVEPGKSYQCQVRPVNSCAAGSYSASEGKACPLPSPTPTKPFCPIDHPETQARCVWDRVSGAIEYKIKIIDGDSGNTILTETVKDPETNLVFDREQGKTYICSVTAVNACGSSTEVKSPPNSCLIITPSVTKSPTPTPSTSITPSPSPTFIPIPSPSVLPSNTPTATKTPTPTVTPTNTLTPTRTPTPSRTPTPTLTPTNAPTATPTITNTPTATNTPSPTATATPTATKTPTPTAKTVTTAQNTPVPSIAATGIFETTAVFGGVALILSLVGAILFLL